MAERLSTGFADAVNDAVATIMANGCIHVYDTIQPADSDLEYAGTLLAIITKDGGAFVSGQPGNGINMGVSADGVLPKSSSEVWSAVGLAPGTAQGFRWFPNVVDNTASVAATRYDGAVGTSSSYELQLLSTAIAVGVPILINDFNYTTTRA